MNRLHRLIRLLALLLAALQVSSRAAATLADARVLRTLATAAAEGRLVHIEGERGADCVRVHEPDCEFCRHLGLSADGSRAPAPLPHETVRPAARVAAVEHRPATIHAGPSSARPPPVV